MTIVTACYVQIPKESGCGWGQEVRGRKHIQLIAIDYHVAIGTAGMGSRGDQGSKVASRPESGNELSGWQG